MGKRDSREESSSRRLNLDCRDVWIPRIYRSKRKRGPVTQGSAVPGGVVWFLVMDKRLAINRKNWDERTPVHAASAFYDVEGFKAGRMTLNETEREEIGPVAGKTLLHLQCHFGMDTMSWARLGARATGVDFSPVAIDLARELNAELGLDARFMCSNVYDLPTVLDERFDIVYTAMGVLVWLPDLTAWAEVVAHFVKPGGVFYILDDHPLCHIFEQEHADELRVRYPYFPDVSGEFFGGAVQSYAGTDLISSPSYEWQHSVAEILNALLAVGLRIEFFHEFPVSGFRRFPCMTRGADGWWRLPEYNDSIPQLFSLRATR